MMINPQNIENEIKVREKAIDRLKKEKEALAKGVEITWKDGTITNEKADNISFDDKKININYKDEVIIIPLKNIKKLKFAESLLKLTYHWSWNPKTYEDSTSDGNPYTTPFVWYKWTSNMDTAGNPTW